MVGSAPIRQVERLLVPIRLAAVIDARRRSERLGPRQLLCAAGGHDDPRTGRHGQLNGEKRHAAGALHQHRLTWPERPVLEERPPGGQCGDGQSRGLGVAQVGRRCHHRLLVHEDVLGQHARQRTAQGRRLLCRRWDRPVQPPGEEVRRHPVALAEAGDSLTHGHDAAGGIRAGHEGKAQVGKELALDDPLVAVVERDGRDTDQKLVRAGRRHRRLREFQTIQAEAGELPLFHRHAGKLRDLTPGSR